MPQCGSEPSADDAKGSHAHLERLEQLHLKRRAISPSLRRHFLRLPPALFWPPPHALFLLLSVNLTRPPEHRNGNPLSVSRGELLKLKRGEGRRKRTLNTEENYLP